MAASLTVAIFSPLFPATKRCPARDRMKWQTAIYYIHYIYYILRGQSPTFGSQSHRQTTGWSPGGSSGGQWTGAPSFTGPSRKSAGWCLNRRLQEAGRNSTLCFPVFSVPPPLTSSSVLTPTLRPLYLKAFVSLGDCCLCGTVLSSCSCKSL